MTDILKDMLQRVAEIHRLPADEIAKIESQLRKDFGGERHYIAEIGETSARMMAQRDIAIRAQHRAGEHSKLLSRRWGISQRRIQQIIKG